MASATDPAQLTGLAGWVVDTIEMLGPLGVGALVALETVFPPIPSEVVLPVAGLLAGQGRMSLLLAVVGVAAGLRSRRPAAVLWLVAAGRGVAFVPESAARLPIEGVAFVRLETPVPQPVELHLLWARSSKNPALWRALAVLRPD